MKQKQLTHQQLEKKALRKQKEIAKWEKEKTRPKKGYYIIYLVFIVSLIQSFTFIIQIFTLTYQMMNNLQRHRFQHLR